MAKETSKRRRAVGYHESIIRKARFECRAAWSDREGAVFIINDFEWWGWIHWRKDNRFKGFEVASLGYSFVSIKCGLSALERSTECLNDTIAYGGISGKPMTQPSLLQEFSGWSLQLLTAESIFKLIFSKGVDTAYGRRKSKQKQTIPYFAIRLRHVRTSIEGNLPRWDYIHTTLP